MSTFNLRLLSLLIAAVATTGCAGLSRAERDRVRQLEQAGIDSTSQGNNSSWVAGVLQIVPGIGNFYLAAGTEENHQIWYGVLNIIPGWLVWPIGVVWAVPQGAVDAHNINQRQTITYYFDTDEGKAALSRHRSSATMASTR